MIFSEIAFFVIASPHQPVAVLGDESIRAALGDLVRSLLSAVIPAKVGTR
jgi:hypothetical protein